MAKVKAQSQVKKKKKIWIQINAPKLFGNKKIGETHVYAAENAVGKRIEQNLMTLTGEMKKQNITIKFNIDRMVGNVAQTTLISYKMVPSFIKRLVRRRRDKIEFSKVFLTKDKQKVRIKPLIITASRTRGSTQTAIIKKAMALMSVQVSKITFDTLVEDVISYRFQGYVKNNLKNLHPLKSCEIRELKLDNKSKANTDVEVEDYSQDKKEEEVEKVEKVEKKVKVAKPKPVKEETTSEDVEEEPETTEEKDEE